MAGSGTGTPVVVVSGTTSGSYDFLLDRTEIIDAALRALGVLRAGDSVANDSTLAADCVEALNLMLKSWQNIGMQLWTTKEVIVDLTANKRTYSWNESGDIAQPTALRVIAGYRRSSSNTDAELIVVTRDEYNRLSNKFASGTPTQIYYDYQDSTGTLYPWPVPSSAGTNIVLVYHEPFDDMDNTTDRLDFPQSWWEAVKWNLAIRLAPEFGRQTPPEVISLAQLTLKNAMENSYEEGSIKFTPSPWMRHR